MMADEMSDRIVLSGLVFEGRHGYGDAERAVPQPIEVDVVLLLDLSAAGSTDDLERSVDYSEVAWQVGRIVQQRTFRLIESIAQAIAGELLATHQQLAAVEVRVHKPNVRLGDGPGGAAVVIRRGRS
jgi:dihydroneopterin aldolase